MIYHEQAKISFNHLLAILEYEKIKLNDSVSKDTLYIDTLSLHSPFEKV